MGEVCHLAEWLIQNTFFIDFLIKCNVFQDVKTEERQFYIIYELMIYTHSLLPRKVKH